MSSPMRWRDDASAPEDVRDLMRYAPRSRTMPAEVRVRSARRLERLIVVPAAAGILLWIKGLAIAGFCAAGAVAVVRLVPVRTDASRVDGAAAGVVVPPSATTQRSPLARHDIPPPPAPESAGPQPVMPPAALPPSVRNVGE